MRDMIDRIFLTCQNSKVYFGHLLNWLLNQRIEGAQEEDGWKMEDFRKITKLISVTLQESPSSQRLV